MIAQDHRPLIAEVAQQALLLLEIEGDALVVVIRDLREAHRRLRDRQEPDFIADTAMPAIVWVWITQSTSCRARVDRAVDDVARLVDAVLGGVEQDLALEIELMKQEAFIWSYSNP